MGWTLHPASHFERHREAWKSVNERGPRTMLLDPDFVGPLLREFPSPPMRLAIRGDPVAPDAMALIWRYGLLKWSTFQPSQSPVGAWVVADGADPVALARELLSRLPGITLSLTHQDPSLWPRPADGPLLRTADYIATARIDVHDTFEAYWATRGKNLRHNLKRQRNRLERDGIVPRLETLVDPADAVRALEDYGRLESAGWKAGMGTAILPDNAQGRFYRAILEHFMARGEARVWRYWYGDQLVASDLCIDRDGVLIILKTCYDESQKTSSPAHLMRWDAFREMFASGRVRRIEFYGRAMDWHRKWSDDLRTMYHVTHARWRWVTRLLGRGGGAGGEEATGATEPEEAAASGAAPEERPGPA